MTSATTAPLDRAVQPPRGAAREPRYTSPGEERRIRRCLQHAVEEAARTGSADPALLDRYTYLFRTVFNSMLRDRARASPGEE